MGREVKRRPPPGGRSGSTYAGQTYLTPSTKSHHPAPYTPRAPPVGVVETPQGVRDGATLSAQEKAAILRRYGALKTTGGRSKSDSVAQIAKDHGVARNYPAKLHKTMMARASTSPKKPTGRPQVYGAEFDDFIQSEVEKARREQKVSSSESIVAAMIHKFGVV